MNVIRPLSILILATASAACVPSLSYSVRGSPSGGIGPRRTIAVARGTGGPAAQSAVASGLRIAAARQGYFRVVDQLDGTALRVKVNVRRAKAELRKSGQGMVGNKYTVDLVAVTSVSVWAGGRPLFLNKIYKGSSMDTASGLRAASAMSASMRQRMLVDALGHAMSRLIKDITPRELTLSIPLDTSDDAQESLLDMARSGDVAGAVAQLDELLKEQPDNAAAIYNLAVMHEVQHHFDKALGLYEQATAMGDKAMYRESWDNCHERRIMVHGRASLDKDGGEEPWRRIFGD